MPKYRASQRWLVAITTLFVIALAVTAYTLTRKQPVQEEKVDWRTLIEEDKRDEEEAYQMPQATAPNKKEIEAAKVQGRQTAIIQTDKGEIEVVLRGDLMPATVANFVKLAKAGFYDGLTFHRVEDWVIQGGCPQGDGYGNPGYTIKLETSKELTNLKGAVAMARGTDPNSAGCQFYILKQKADWLDGQYAVFGNVMKGLPVVEGIDIGDKIIKVTVK